MEGYVSIDIPETLVAMEGHVSSDIPETAATIPTEITTHLDTKTTIDLFTEVTEGDRSDGNRATTSSVSPLAGNPNYIIDLASIYFALITCLGSPHDIPNSMLKEKSIGYGYDCFLLLPSICWLELISLLFYTTARLLMRGGPKHFLMHIVTFLISLLDI